ncbi:MAG: NUDIX domain-containing protein [Planctomycetes bacterium]|nr:NUDIX domain-containing protein [Planctomycetota bacterium]
MPNTPSIEIIVRGTLVRGSRLLVCRSVQHGYAYLPGGHVAFGESAQAALEREFLEETGLSVRAGLCSLVAEEMFEQQGARRHEYSLVFHVEHAGPTDRLDAVKSREPAITFDWIDVAAVGDIDLRPASIRAWLVAGAPAPGEFYVPATPH